MKNAKNPLDQIKRLSLPLQAFIDAVDSMGQDECSKSLIIGLANAKADTDESEFEVDLVHKVIGEFNDAMVRLRIFSMVMEGSIAPVLVDGELGFANTLKGNAGQLSLHD